MFLFLLQIFFIELTFGRMTRLCSKYLHQAPNSIAIPSMRNRNHPSNEEINEENGSQKAHYYDITMKWYWYSQLTWFYIYFMDNISLNNMKREQINVIFTAHSLTRMKLINLHVLHNERKIIINKKRKRILGGIFVCNWNYVLWLIDDFLSSSSSCMLLSTSFMSECWMWCNE